MHTRNREPETADSDARTGRMYPRTGGRPRPPAPDPPGPLKLTLHDAAALALKQNPMVILASRVSGTG